MKTVRVRVPATTANLGPGFDCLALALALYNTAELSLTEGQTRVEVEGEGADVLPHDDHHLTLQAARRALEALGRRPAGFHLRARNAIPPASGLGSSAAAVVAGLVAANALAGGGLSTEDLLALATELEGHADNAAAALLGGLTAVAPDGRPPLARRLPCADLKVAVALPQVRLRTAEMRRALPEKVPLADAAFNLGRTVLVVEALRQGDYDLLARALEDRLHQPYRAPFIPGFGRAVAAARGAGAAAVALSGAGPALVAFAPAGHQVIADAMAEAFRQTGAQARTFTLGVDREGAQAEDEG